MDPEAEDAFWSDEEDWWLSVVWYDEMHFMSHDRQYARVSTPVPLQSFSYEHYYVSLNFLFVFYLRHARKIQ